LNFILLLLKCLSLDLKHYRYDIMKTVSIQTLSGGTSCTFDAVDENKLNLQMAQLGLVNVSKIMR